MRSEQSLIGIQRNMWLAAKDLSKINEGEVKDYSVGATELKLTGTIWSLLLTG